MNNRFLFRGKSTNEKEEGGVWVVGHYAGEDYGIHYIRTAAKFYSVYSETIGQCTGLRDKNGRLIFEGDIVSKRLVHSYVQNELNRRCRHSENRNDNAAGLVRFVSQLGINGDKEYFTKIVWVCAGFERHGDFGYHPIHGKEIEIIGNIHDNGELLNP